MYTNADLAAAIHKAADLLIERQISGDSCERAHNLLTDLHRELLAGEPIALDTRIERFIEQMSPAEQVVEGQTFLGFAESPYSGHANALTPRHVEYRREGDSVVATIIFGTALEGRPGRAHGGATAAVFDDVMGAVQRIIGRNGYTRTLSVNYLAPMPTNSPVTVTARQTSAADGRFIVEAAAVAQGTTVATSQAIFTEVSIDTFGQQGPSA